MRGPSIGSVRELFARWQALAGPPSAALAASLEAMVRQLELDRRHYSDVFEPSLSWDGQGAHVRRFSYAFPGFRRAMDETSRAFLALAAPFGGAIVDAAQRLLRAARHDAVEQPLFGYADDREPRAKLYLQFRDGASVAAGPLIAAVTGVPVDGARLGGAIHMLGLDVGAGGVRGAKAYVFPHAPVALAARFERPLSRILHVHRMTDPGNGFPEQPSEVDFSLAENRLSEADVIGSRLLRTAHPDGIAELEALRAALPIAIRRVSIAIGNDPKITFYYVPIGE
jgi:hypothetical protein